MKKKFFRVSLKDIKAFLRRINYKISTCKLREAFQEVDTKKRNEIGFDDFTILHNKLIFDEVVRQHKFLFTNKSCFFDFKKKNYFRLLKKALMCMLLTRKMVKW